MTIYGSSTFKPGDMVIIDWSGNAWPVTKVVNGKVWVETQFGECEYQPEDLEFFDVPF